MIFPSKILQLPLPLQLPPKYCVAEKGQIRRKKKVKQTATVGVSTFKVCVRMRCPARRNIKMCYKTLFTLFRILFTTSKLMLTHARTPTNKDVSLLVSAPISPSISLWLLTGSLTTSVFSSFY